MKYKTYKFKLEPNSAQRDLIGKTLGCCRLLYNCMLDECQSKYKAGNKSKFMTEKEYKQKYPFLCEVDSIALQQTRLDLQSAYKSYFKNKNQGKKASLKFKSRKNQKNSYRTLNQENGIRIEQNKIKLPKLGWIKIKKSRKVRGEIKNVTITRTLLDKYYISILTEQEIKPLPKVNKSVGIDLGINDFLTDSDGNKYPNPRFLQRYEQRLNYEQRRLSRKKVGSNRYFKQQKRIAKLYEKISNQRKDFLHKLSSKLVNENQVISLEDLNIISMLNNHKLSKSISDVSWGEFIRLLKYKAEWYGREAIQVNRFFPSSKLCHCCGHKYKSLQLNQRHWQCWVCNCYHDRDINSAINILLEGKRILSTVGRTGNRALEYKTVFS